MRIFIAPDKFKGSLTSREAAQSLRAGLEKSLPESEFSWCPLADGGEGTAAIFGEFLQGQTISVATKNALGTPITAEFIWIAERKLAAVDMSTAAGLAQISKESRNPETAHTQGLGTVIQACREKGAEQIFIGLGGSATNDAGIGLAAALGWKFLDASGRELPPEPIRMLELERIQPPEQPLGAEIIGLCDVENPLLGPKGCTQVFGPQKGVSESSARQLEQALFRIAEAAARENKRDFRDTPGSGAAGGLGFGILTFCRGSLRPGFDTLAELLGLEDEIRQADLVITAEGKLDSQTAQGKGPAGVARLAKKFGKPVIAFAGTFSHEEEVHSLFDAVVPIPHAPISLEDSMKSAATLLERAAERCGRLLTLGHHLSL